MSVRVIVNADDLGRTEGINEGIFEAHRRGVVTSATLMVAHPSSEKAADTLALHPELGVGLHVALTGGEPCLPAERVPSLVDHEGRLAAKPELLGELEPGEVRSEVRAQLERFRELTEGEPTHLDSHHHSHRHPVVLEAVVEVASEIGCPVRRSSPEIADRLRAAFVVTTDAFVERFFGEEATAEALSSILRECGPGTTEIMCHPGRVDEELRAGSSYVEERERELEILCSSSTLGEFHRLGIERVTYADLREGGRW